MNDAEECEVPEESEVNNYRGSTPDIIPRESHSPPPTDSDVTVDHHGNKTKKANPDILPTEAEF